MLRILCSLIAALTDVDAVIVLTQTPGVHTVSTGQEAVLNCNIQRDNNQYVSWYKQKPSGTSHSPSFGTGFSSDRFNSKASFNVDYQLIIKQTEKGDSLMYYCSVWDSSASAAVSPSLDIQTSDWNMDKVYTCKVSLGSQTAEKNINKSGCSTQE
uniref:Ig-like domain-containing protein n=1 Tax=Acanthochromis polyacanthus TaxID=80966 RepID=A0A3Q1EIE2_9TELE